MFTLIFINAKLSMRSGWHVHARGRILASLELSITSRKLLSSTTCIGSNINVIAEHEVMGHQNQYQYPTKANEIGAR